MTGPGPQRPRSRRRLVVLLALVLLPAALVRGCVISTYVVRSDSMEPEIMTGDHLLVLRDSVDMRPLKRWDVLLLDRAIDAEVPEGFGAVVKRLVGLPGEHVQIRDGDVWTGPAQDRLTLARRPEALVAAMLVPVHRGRGLSEPWSWSGAVPLRTDDQGSLLRSPAGASWAVFDRAIHDGTLDREGAELVSDTALRVTVGEVDGTLLLGLREGVDLFRARLGGPGRGGASLHHNLAVAPLASDPDFEGLQPGSVVLLWNVDDRLCLWVDGRLVLAFDHGTSTDQAPGTTLLNTPELGVEGGTVALREVVVLRDVHYGAQGSYGHPAAALPTCRVPDDGAFVLGDASERSRDGRHFGPVSLDWLLGRLLARYLPADRAGWLDTAGVRR